MRAAFDLAKVARPCILVLPAGKRLFAERAWKMALHRDLYWVCRQWAVTGYGLQAVDQKQKGKFDIEASRLWKDDGLESVRAERWLNPDDFEKALAVARKRFPEPPRKAASPQWRVRIRP